ncbi:hypothetical protein FRB99_004425 [Tulasnella sp. 403]|nr:hypothetical protein FRB99_004425 [Tulasnella sp. 403]
MSYSGNLEEAYAILGLPTGSDMDAVKKAYKAKALQKHPDKAPKDKDQQEDATVEFQQISAAYTTVMDYLERDDDDFYDDEDDDDDTDFYEFLTKVLHLRLRSRWTYTFNFREPRYSHLDPQTAFYSAMYDEMFGNDARSDYGRSGPRFRSTTKPRETAEQYHARMEKTRQEQEEARKIRQEEEQRRKAMRAQEAAARAENSAESRKAKAERQKESRKATAEANRVASEKKAREALERRQKTRSDVFEAARRGDDDAVRKGIWESNVDAAGGEALKGGDDLIANKADNWDPLETLLHIAVSRGGLALVQWLVDHNAEPEERDSVGRTAFNRALALGNLPIIQYFLTTFAPDSDESTPVLSAPATDCIVRLAVESANPDVVTLVFNAGLVDLHDVNRAWLWMDEQAEKGSKTLGGKYDRVRAVLSLVEGWTPPSTPRSDDMSIPGTGSEVDVEDAKQGYAQQANQRRANENAKQRLRQRTTPTGDQKRKNTYHQSTQSSSSLHDDESNSKTPWQTSTRGAVHGAGRARSTKGQGKRFSNQGGSFRQVPVPAAV